MTRARRGEPQPGSGTLLLELNPSVRHEMQSTMMSHASRLGLLIVLGAVLAAGCRRGDASYAGTPSVEGDTLLRFPSGAAYVSGMRSELSYLGQIPDGDRGPFVLVAGVECEGCDAGLSVLLRSVRDPAFISGDTSTERSAGWYAYPGRILHFDDGAPIIDSRLYWGRCLPDRAPGVVQFATDFDSAGRQVRSLVRITEIRRGRLVDDSILQSPPTPSAVQPALRAGTCREVAPREQHGGL